MITWTTPVLPVRLNTGRLDENGCDVYGTFSQDGKSLTLEPTIVTCDAERDESILVFKLSQLQTGGFRPGPVGVQVNIVDRMGFRAATPFRTVYVGTNALAKEVEHA